MHVEYSNEQALQRNTEKLNQQLHGLIILVADWCRPQDIYTALQYLVHIVNILGVVFDRKVHECHFQFKKLEYLNGLALLINDLVGVLLNELEDF
jgi:predicted translin family RNA/ssDNA-binding protein